MADWKQFIGNYQSRFKKIDKVEANAWYAFVRGADQEALDKAFDILLDDYTDKKADNHMHPSPKLSMFEREYKKHFKPARTTFEDCLICNNTGTIFIVSDSRGTIFNPMDPKPISPTRFGVGVRAMACRCKRGDNRDYSVAHRATAAKYAFRITRYNIGQFTVEADPYVSAKEWLDKCHKLFIEEQKEEANAKVKNNQRNASPGAKMVPSRNDIQGNCQPAGYIGIQCMEHRQ